MDRGCPLDLLDSVRPQRASGTRPYGAPALGGIGVVVCGFAVRPLMFQGNGNTRGGECNPPTGDLIPAGPQAARLCRVVASPHISPIVAKTRIGDWSPAGRTGNRADAWDAGRTRHPWGSRLLRAGWNGARERMRRRTGATPAASRRSADRAGSARQRRRMREGSQIAPRGRIGVLEGVDGGKRQPHLARGDADHGGDLEQLEADGGALRLGHGRAGQAHLPHGVHQHVGKG